MSAKNHYIIIMAGGVGSRFWPMSRTAYPKQFHDILGRGQTLIQETVARFEAFVPTENIYIVTNEIYAGLIAEQLPQLSKDQLLYEPVARNTAPCVAYACYKIRKRNPNACFVVAPADHLIADGATFQRNIELGLQVAASQPAIVTLGITPTRPDTGYGYIQYLTDAENTSGYYRVKTFTEKPSLEVAKQFVASGDFVWNSGIFLFSSATITKAFEEFLPDMADLFSGISDTYYTDLETGDIAQVYAAAQSISIDYGIMEKSRLTYVIPSEFGWSDLGTWTSVHENSPKDPDQNVLQGERLLAYKSANNMVRIDDKKKVVVLNGVEDLIIVDTGDVLFIGRKDDEQFIKQVTTDVKASYGKGFV